MKRIFSFVIFVLGLLLFSCGNVAGSGRTGPAPTPTPDPDESKADWSGQTVNEGTFSASNYMFEVTNTTRNLDIALPDGNYDIFMVEINNSPYIVPANQNQWIVAGGFLNSERSAYDADGFVLASDLSDEINFSDFEFPEDDGRVKREHFVDTFVPPPFYGNAPSLRSASPSYFPPINPNYVAPVVGTEKQIWVDVKNPSSPGSISRFREKTATLQAVGRYCYVWVVNEYLGSGFKQIESTAAVEMKNAFDGFYEYVRYVFGEEADFIITGPNSTREMDDKKVNIVVYDILEDATEQQSGGTLGYFARKDYYEQESVSNKGKYFYVDSYFAKKYPEETYSTLAHEFQHMISFNVKYLQGVDGYSGYNEMLSMLCEDMLQTKMGLTDIDSPKGRFLTFLSNYYKYGIFDEPDGAGFYSVTYMFGAFLARNYGGAKLVHHMAHNNERNEKSITAALHEMGYHSDSFETVLKEYAKALVLENNEKTFNKPAETYSDFVYDGYNFPMTEFDIFNFPARGESHSMKVLLRKTNNITNKSSRKSLHAEGIIPYYVGRVDRGGDLRLTFSSPANPNSKAYILVQKN